MSNRIASFFDLKLTARGLSRSKNNAADFESKPKSISAIAKNIEHFVKNNDNCRTRKQNKDSVSYYLSDILVDSDKLVLLINKSDPKSPDPVSSDPESGERTEHKKPKNHGGDYSAHVVIKVDPLKSDNYYLCMVESVYGSGMSSAVVKRFLNHLLRKCATEFPKQYKIPNISDSNKLVRHVHAVELDGHPSDSFLIDLQNGFLSEMEAISYTEVGSVFDNVGGVEERHRTIVLKPQMDLIGDVASSVRTVRNTLFKNYRQYSELRLRFKSQNDEPRNAKISVETGLLVDSDKYLKKYYLKSVTPNLTSLDKISGLIVNELLTLAK